MRRHAESQRRAPRAPAYSRYAEVYDLIGQRTFGEKIAEATLAYLDAHQVKPEHALDLACGTGAATLVLAAAGMRVTGCDNSEAMIAAARIAADDAGLPVQWQLQDMRAIAITHPVDLVTCFYDAINYLLSVAEIRITFEGVNRALRTGGYFVFDLNTREKFNTGWNTSCYVATDRDDLFGIYQSWFEADTGISPLILTFFVGHPDGAWERFDEEHVERAYALAEIRELLVDAGFEVVELLDYADRCPRFGGPGSERSHRVVFVAQKPDVGSTMEAQS